MADRVADCSGMTANRTIEFFETQFAQQTDQGDLALNPFELAALPYLKGRVLDFGCGLGNLAFAAAQRGCSVLALDASPTAIASVRQRASGQALPVEAELADLRNYEIDGDFDAVVSIGLLMFLDCPAALRALTNLQAHVREGGVAVVNVLIEGTSFLDMFDPDHHCLMQGAELERRFAGWEVLLSENRDFDAPRGLKKSFSTVIARKPNRPTNLAVVSSHEPQIQGL